MARNYSKAQIQEAREYWRNLSEEDMRAFYEADRAKGYTGTLSEYYYDSMCESEVCKYLDC